MRRTLIGVLVAAAVALVPVCAMAGNQESAEKIAAALRDSGQLQDYKIGVKFQEGTVWLRGRVTSQEQLDAATKLALQAPGVTRVVNNLEVASQDTAQPVLTQASASLEKEAAARSPIRELLPTAAGRLVSTSRIAMRSKEAAAEPTPARVAAEPTPAIAALPVGAVMAPGAAMVAMAQPTGTPMPVARGPMPQYVTPVSGGMPAAQYDQPNLPNYAWPSYAAYPNYAALTYPKQYSPTAWPYIGPFYPYPQVPLGWRKVALEWHDGWWQLDFDDNPRTGWFSGLFRAPR